MVLVMSLLGCLPDSPARRWSAQRVSVFCFQFMSNTLSAVITYHNPENRPRRGICVANHTTPIDVLVLSCDKAYSLVCLSVPKAGRTLYSRLQNEVPLAWCAGVPFRTTVTG